MNQNKKMFAVIAVVVVAVVIGLLAANMNKKSATDTKTSSATAVSNAVATKAVTIENYMFSPMAIKVKVGDTVTWTNKDSVQHSVIADAASADAPSGPLLAKDATYDFKFTKAGTFTIHCGPHPYMKATVVVAE